MVTANRVKWAFFSLMLAFGLGFLGLMVFCGLKYRKEYQRVNPAGNNDEFADALDTLPGQNRVDSIN